MKYQVIMSEHLYGAKFKETVMFESEDKLEAALNEDFLRKTYKCDGITCGIYMREIEE